MASEVLDGELLTDQRDGIDEQQAYKYEEFRSSAAGQDSSLLVTVYRHPTNPDGTAMANAKLQYMFQLPVDQLTREQILDKVSREYMAPNDAMWYVRIHIRRPGTRGILFNELCTVLRQPRTTETDVAGTGGSESARILGAVGKMLADAQARTDALFSRLLEQQQKPGMSQVELFLMAQKQSAEMFEKLAIAMRGSTPGTAPVTSSLDDTLKSMLVFKQIKDFMGGEFGAGGSQAAENATAEILKAAGPIAKPFLELMVENMRAKRLPNPAKPAETAKPDSTAKEAKSAAAPAAPATDVKAKESVTKEPAKNMANEDRMLFAMRDQLGQLADAIAMNPDPAAVGGTILENLPESYDEPLFTLLSGEDWFDRMCAVQNKLRPHKEWMLKLRAYIIESMTEVDDNGAANDET